MKNGDSFAPIKPFLMLCDLARGGRPKPSTPAKVQKLKPQRVRKFRRVREETEARPFLYGCSPGDKGHKPLMASLMRPKIKVKLLLVKLKWGILKIYWK